MKNFPFFGSVELGLTHRKNAWARPYLSVKIDWYSIGVGAVKHYETRPFWYRVLWYSIIVASSSMWCPYFGAVVNYSVFCSGVLDCCTRLPIKAVIRLLSIPQARKWLPGLQTSILNCSKTLLSLVPLQINRNPPLISL